MTRKKTLNQSIKNKITGPGLFDPAEFETVEEGKKAGVLSVSAITIDLELLKKSSPQELSVYKPVHHLILQVSADRDMMLADANIVCLNTIHF